MARKLKKGDLVVVIAGDGRHLPYEKRFGAIKVIDRAKDKVVVEGINVRKIAMKRSAQNQQGGFVERECPVHVSNVMLKDVYDSQYQIAEEVED